MADLHIASYLAPSLFPLYEAVGRALHRRLGVEVEVTDERSYSSFAADRPDLSFICSLAWIHFRDLGMTSARPVAAPILSGDRYGDRPIYFSDVIVHNRSAARHFLDLRGRSWSYNEPLSQSGYGVTRHHLVSLGETGGFFGDVVAAGSHAASIRMVAEGEIEGSAIDSHVLEVTLKSEPRMRERIRIIDRLGPSSIQPVTMSDRVAPDLRAQIVETLVSLHADRQAAPVLAASLVDRFVAVDPDTYQDVRRMLDTCREAGFMQLR
jgi:phosphonate transport system substrate-binding protein